MLEIFVRFLGDIGLKIFSTIDKLKSPKEQLKKFIYLFISLNRIYENLQKFHQDLQSWQQSDFHGSRWSRCQETLRAISDSFKLLRSDAAELQSIEELGLSKGTIGFLDMRHSVFSVWSNIIGNNAVKNFCSWESQYSDVIIDGKSYIKSSRTIYVPSYSILLHGVKSTEELENIKDSYYENAARICFDDVMDYYKSYFPRDSFRDTLSYLPEIPPGKELPIKLNIQIPNYVKEILIPEQRDEIDEIIRTTGEAAEKLGLAIEILRQALKDYTACNSIDISDFI